MQGTRHRCPPTTSRRWRTAMGSASSVRKA